MKTKTCIYFLTFIALVLFVCSAQAEVEGIFTSEYIMSDIVIDTTEYTTIDTMIDTTTTTIDTTIDTTSDSTTYDTTYVEPYPTNVIKTTLYLTHLNSFPEPIFSIQLAVEWNKDYYILDSIFFNTSYWGSGLIHNIIDSENPAQCRIAGSYITAISPQDSTPREVFTAYLTRPQYDSPGGSEIEIKSLVLNETWVINNLPLDAPEESELLPEQFSLLQNYPNPFNPTTTIDFSLARAGQVKLCIFNVLGQEIKTVDFGFMHVGEHSFIWNGTDNNNREVTSGVYFYRLEGEQVTEAKKMILLK